MPHPSTAPETRPAPLVSRALELSRVDFPSGRRRPRSARLVVATVASIVGSLAVDAALVAVGTALFPSTRGYAHFRFPDYSRLTVVGVVVACVAWPVVIRISSAPRWLFLRLAVVVTLVLLLPDLYILLQGQAARAVAVLVAMHLAIALVTYTTLVRVAPPTAAPSGSGTGTAPRLVRG